MHTCTHAHTHFPTQLDGFAGELNKTIYKQINHCPKINGSRGQIKVEILLIS